MSMQTARPIFRRGVVIPEETAENTIIRVINIYTSIRIPYVFLWNSLHTYDDDHEARRAYLRFGPTPTSTLSPRHRFAAQSPLYIRFVCG